MPSSSQSERALRGRDSEDGFPQGAHTSDDGGNDQTHQHTRENLTEDTRTKGELPEFWVLKGDRSTDTGGKADEGRDPTRKRSLRWRLLRLPWLRANQ